MIYTYEWIYQLRMAISANMHTLTFFFLIATSESRLQGLPSESFWSVSLTLPSWWVSRLNHCLTSLPFATIRPAPFPPASSILESCAEQRDRAAPTVWGAEGLGGVCTGPTTGLDCRRSQHLQFCRNREEMKWKEKEETTSKVEKEHKSQGKEKIRTFQYSASVLELLFYHFNTSLLLSP